MSTMERAIIEEARRVLCNRKLRIADLMEWSTGEIREVKGEVRLWLNDLGVWIAVQEQHDKRKEQANT